MVYGVGVSKIKVKENQEFYNQDIKIKEEYIYAERKEMKKQESSEQVVEATQKVDMDKYIKENEEKKKISQAIEKY